MILVDIVVASSGNKYEYKLDENAYVIDIVEEIGRMLTDDALGIPEDTIKNLMLCSKAKHGVLNPEQSLKQQGIGNGEELLLL